MPQVLWDGYVDGMKRTAFTADADLYVATGLDASSDGSNAPAFAQTNLHTDQYAHMQCFRVAAGQWEYWWLRVEGHDLTHLMALMQNFWR